MHPLLFVQSSCMSLLTDVKSSMPNQIFFSPKMAKVNAYLTKYFTCPVFKISLESLIFMLKSGQRSNTFQRSLFLINLISHSLSQTAKTSESD